MDHAQRQDGAGGYRSSTGGRYQPERDRLCPMNVAIIGAGGFGREVLDVIEALQNAGMDIECVGFVDDGTPDLERLAARGLPLLGPTSLLEHLGAAAVIGIGAPSTKAAIDARLLAWAVPCATLIHPSATVGSLVELGPGTVVTAGARLTTNIRLGRHAQLHVNCTVGHDVVAGDHLTVSPGATIGGEVTIGNGVMLGTNSAVIQGLTIGDGAIVGAGAAVVRDVAPSTTVVGVPARAR